MIKNFFYFGRVVQTFCSKHDKINCWNSIENNLTTIDFCC
jgi:hypothetical protein